MANSDKMELCPISSAGQVIDTETMSSESKSKFENEEEVVVADDPNNHNQQQQQDQHCDSEQPLLPSDKMKEVVKNVLQNGATKINPLGSSGGGGLTTDKHKTNTETSSMMTMSMETNEPKDRYNIVLIILIVHGIGILMPWNMFINADKYFTDYKLTYTHSNGTKESSIYKEYFLSYLGVASQIPNVLFNLFNIFFHFGGNNFTLRITGAIVLEILIIVATIVLAIVNTNEWTSTFFYLTMASVVVLNIANGVYQNSLYGLASKLPMRYSNAVVLGSNISGTFTSVINIISIWASPNIRIAAVYYFVSALFVLLVCFDTYLALPINRFFRYHVLDERNSAKKDACAEQEEGIVKVPQEDNQQDLAANQTLIETSKPNAASQRPPYLLVLRYAWKQCLNVFLVFFVTLSIFPVIQAGIGPVNETYFGGDDPSTTQRYFTAVCCFLVFNSFAMFGNIIPNFVQLPGPDRLWVPVVARFLFIPFFLLCNFAPENRTWPVYIQSDTLYVFGGMLMGLSSGYLSSLCMMFAPKSVPPEHAGTAGMMAAACLVMGIFFGVNFSFLLAWLVKQ